jgi:hypothetical protein
MDTSAFIFGLRERYRPEKIKVLFIAESPPKSNDDEVRFFYNPRQERWDYLYRAVMKAVFTDFEYSPREKDNWLHKFKEHGYYLIDATDYPVNDLPSASAERRHKIEDAAKAKLAEIAKLLVSKSTPILLIKKNVFAAFNCPLREAGYNVVNASFLPFPAQGHQQEFIEKCRDYLAAR